VKIIASVFAKVVKMHAGMAGLKAMVISLWLRSNL
jgi:hypothetical protein